MMINPFEIPCVILSGGKSSRMGEDKSLLPFDKTPSLTQYQYERLKPYFKKVYISSKTNKFDFLEDNSSLILDTNEIYSPLVALKSIFSMIKDTKVFIITVDTPLVKIQSIQKLIENAQSYDICIAKTSRVHNLCGVFDYNISKNIDKMLDKNIHKIKELFKDNKVNIIEFLDDDEFINLNNKLDYERSKDIISLSNNL